MSFKLKAALLGVILSLGVCSWGWALPLSDYNKLNDITVERSRGELHIQVHFKKAPANHEPPVFFKKSIQVDLPYTYLAPAKQYFPTGDAEIKQVYASQFDSELLRIRFILGDRGENLVERFKMQRIGNILDVRIKPLAGFSKTPGKTPVETQVKKKTPDPLDGLFERANVIQKENEMTLDSGAKPKKHAESLLQLFEEPQQPESAEVEGPGVFQPEATELSKTVGSAFQKKTGQSLSQVLSGNKDATETPVPTTPVGEGKGPDLASTGFKMFSMLVVVLGIMFLVYYLFKKFVWKNSVFGSGSKPIKVLSTGFLGPKKSIALVEVAGEVLVLGISNDHISLLGNVEEPGRIDLIKGTGEEPKVPSPSKSSTGNSGIPEADSHEPAGEDGKVDAYESRRRQNTDANPFPEMVKEFDGENGESSPSMQELSERLNRNLKATEPIA